MSKRRIHKLLVALTDSEIDQFFPGELYGEIEALFPVRERLQTPDTTTPEQLAQTIRQSRTEVLLAAWSTPALPEGLQNEFGSYLKYYCNLTGTVRNRIPRIFIEKGLIVTNWGDSVSDTVAECGLLLILACLRSIQYWGLQMHEAAAWKHKHYASELTLFNKRVGIHGFGGISRKLVTLLKPFEVSLKTYSPHAPDSLLQEYDVRRAHSLEDLFEWASIIVELAALTPENHGIVKEFHLRAIGETGCFVNVGRGAIVDQEALIRIAREGRLKIGLDVYDPEPLPHDSPLRGLDNVTLLPHIAGPTEDRKRDCGIQAIDNLRRYCEGTALKNVVDLAVYDRST